MENRTEEEVGHGVIYDHAGDVYYRLGWHDRAVAFWTKAVKLAEADKSSTREVRDLLAKTPAKIRAVREGRPANVAPLGAASTRTATPTR